MIFPCPDCAGTGKIISESDEGYECQNDCFECEATGNITCWDCMGAKPATVRAWVQNKDNSKHATHRHFCDDCIAEYKRLGRVVLITEQ